MNDRSSNMAGPAIFTVLFVTLVGSAAYAGSVEPGVLNGVSQEKRMSKTAATLKAKTADNQSGGNLIVFSGICDGSAAIRLDDETILVAYDELNTLFAFALSGGAPTARVELGAMLDLKTSDEIDIEAATISGERIWWAGSHSKTKVGQDEPNRRMLFATNIPSADLRSLKVVAAPLDLFEVLLNSAEVRAVLTIEALQRLPKEGGVNIEGLAATTDGGLLVGFRSPLSEASGESGNALVVKLMPKEGTFKVQRVSLLDLGDRGIRDLVNDGTGYIIVAGPVSPGGKFALFTWNGTNRPQQTMRLDELNAESIVDLGSRWLVLSDDGRMKRTDEEANDGDRICDNIRKKNSKGEAHPNVFFRAKMLPK